MPSPFPLIFCSIILVDFRLFPSFRSEAPQRHHSDVTLSPQKICTSVSPNRRSRCITFLSQNNQALFFLLNELLAFYEQASSRTSWLKAFFCKPCKPKWVRRYASVNYYHSRKRKVVPTAGPGLSNPLGLKKYLMLYKESRPKDLVGGFQKYLHATTARNLLDAQRVQSLTDEWVGSQKNRKSKVPEACRQSCMYAELECEMCSMPPLCIVPRYRAWSNRWPCHRQCRSVAKKSVFLIGWMQRIAIVIGIFLNRR